MILTMTLLVVFAVDPNDDFNFAMHEFDLNIL